MGNDYKFILFIFLITIMVIPNVEASLEKLSNVMPSATTLISEKGNKKQAAIIATNYKFSTALSEEEILNFYRNFFTDEGFTELKSRSSKTEAGLKATIYPFSGQNQIIFLAISNSNKNAPRVYYISLIENDTERITNNLIKFLSRE